MRVRVRVQIHCAEEDRALGPRVRFNSLARVRRATHAVTEHLVDARDHPVEAEAVERLEQALQRGVGLLCSQVDAHTLATHLVRVRVGLRLGLG